MSVESLSGDGGSYLFQFSHLKWKNQGYHKEYEYNVGYIFSCEEEVPQFAVNEVYFSAFIYCSSYV